MNAKMIIKKSLLCTGFLLFCAKTSAEVLTITDNGFTIENKIVVAKSTKDSWIALTQHVDKWWPSDHTWWGLNSNLKIDTFAGGCFCEIDGDKSAEHMRISFVDPNKLLRMTGGLGPLQGMGMFGALDWQLKELDETKTEVSLKYTVSGIINKEQLQQFAPIVDKVQAIQLGGLETFLKDK